MHLKYVHILGKIPQTSVILRAEYAKSALLAKCAKIAYLCSQNDASLG